MTKIINSHIKFIQLVSEGKTYENAYQLAINKKSTPKSCRESGSVLAKKYAKEIDRARKKYTAILEQANDSKVVKDALKSILTQAEVDAHLSKIIKGELIEVQQLSQNGKVFKAKVTPTIAEQRAAIETYNKRFGSNGAVKITEVVEGDIDYSKLSEAALIEITKLRNK